MLINRRKYYHLFVPLNKNKHTNLFYKHQTPWEETVVRGRPDGPEQAKCANTSPAASNHPTNTIPEGFSLI